jgi:SAM-dependent methyltransferase
VLEIGCGQGSFGARLAVRYRYVGVEPDERSFQIAQARLEGFDDAIVYHGEQTAVPHEERFDTVCAFEVLEHIDDDRGAISEWAERLRPGGTLILSVPAGTHRYAAADEMVGHFRRYDPSDLARLLVDAGLQGVHVRRYGAPFGYVLESVRNFIGRRMRTRLREESQAERSARSGRLLHPPHGPIAAAVYLLMIPFRKLELAFPDRGPGLIGVGRRPAGHGS